MMREAIHGATTVAEIRELMAANLAKVVPLPELHVKAELVHEIIKLKRERNAIILGHNYMEPALYHTVPDHVGDSLGLARVSAESAADIIVFCGVKFMAETAKILNPSRTVLLPSLRAGCSLAAAITPEDIRKLREEFPGAPVVNYVNTYADVKAETDVCCTSSNAVAVANHLFDQGHDHILFLPDQYLTANVAAELGVPVIVPKVLGGRGADALEPGRRALITWNGTCEVHELFTPEDIATVRKQYPDVVVLAHPECNEDVVAESDFSGSTSAMIQYVQEVDAPRYLLLTECSMGDNIIAENPQREVLRLCSHRCPHMGEITLEDTLEALQKTQYRIELSAELIGAARASLDRMLEIGPRAMVGEETVETPPPH